VTSMVAELSRHGQHATLLCWSQLDQILSDRLARLHHSLGNDVLPPAEAAQQFSNIVGDLLLEYGLSKSAYYGTNGRHRPRHIESTLLSLSVTKNRLHKNINSNSQGFIDVVRAHNKVLRCYHRQQRTNEVCKNERDFLKNPWEYAHKKLQPSDSTEPSFDAEAATIYFTNTYSDNSVTYENHLPSWASESIPECDPSSFNTEVITPG